MLVTGEVLACRGSNVTKNLAECGSVTLCQLRTLRGKRDSGGRMAKAGELRRQIGGWENDVDLAGLDRAARHGAVLGVGGRLGHRDAAPLLDPPDPLRSIGPRAGENHTDRLDSVRFGQGPKEHIDRRAAVGCLRSRGDPQLAVAHLQVLVRLDDVDVILFDRQRLGNLPNGHPGVGLEQLCHLALVMRVEMDDDDERHPGVVRQIAEEALERT
jgi:hypothetical protein